MINDKIEYTIVRMDGGFVGYVFLITQIPRSDPGNTQNIEIQKFLLLNQFIS